VLRSDPSADSPRLRAQTVAATSSPPRTEPEGAAPAGRFRGSALANSDSKEFKSPLAVLTSHQL